MGYRGKLTFFTICLSVFLLLAGCSFQQGANKPKDEEKDKTEQVKEKKNQSKEEKDKDKDKAKEDTVPSDKELIAVLEKNLETMLDGDIEGYMATIHDESPSYETTEQLMKQLTSQYKLDIKVDEMEVMEKSATEAKVSFVQTTIKLEGPEFMNNKTTGYHILKPYKGEWKVYESGQTDIVYLDEKGNPIDENKSGEGSGQDGNETKEGPENDVPAFHADEGDYEYISEYEKLDFTIDDRNWKLDFYDEDVTNGIAIAEFVLNNETVHDWSELFTIHYYKDGKLRMEPQSFIDEMEIALHESVTGDIKFLSYDVTANEGYYEFYLQEDAVEADQHELARIFFVGNDMFIVRYTKEGEQMDDATKINWITTLKQVRAIN